MSLVVMRPVPRGSGRCCS